MRYNATRHKMEIGATKRKKIRTVDFCDTLAEILKKARKQQHRERFQCGEMYFRNYYQKVMEKGLSAPAGVPDFFFYGDNPLSPCTAHG